LRGVSGTTWPGRTRLSAFSRAPFDRARLRSSRIRRRSSLTEIGASDAVSTPHAMPASIWPSAILFATRTTASRPVPHACCTS
jgi:hypothetical protein